MKTRLDQMLQDSLSAFMAPLLASLERLHARFSDGETLWQSLIRRLTHWERVWTTNVDEQRTQDRLLEQRLITLTKLCSESEGKLNTLETEWEKFVEQERHFRQSIEARVKKLENE